MTAPPDRAALPQELVNRDRWVLFKLKWNPKRKKFDKIPRQARNPMGLASSTDPATWSSFEVAVAALPSSECEGLGFVLNGNGIAAVDLDDCIDGDGEALPWARAILDGLPPTYTETSPSGQGIRMFLLGRLPGRGIKRNGVELYDTGRFLTVTGDRFGAAPLTLADAGAELAALATRLRPPAPGKDKSGEGALPEVPVDIGPMTPEDKVLLDAVREMEPQAAALWDGNWQGRYPSQSDADFALVGYLHRAGADPGRIQRVFRTSRLYRPKTDSRRAGGRTYLTHTIEELLKREADAAPAPAAAPGRRPTIDIHPGDARAVGELEARLRAAGRQVYQRGGMLVTIARAAEVPRSGIDRDPETPVIVRLTRARLWELACEVARFQRLTPRGAAVDCQPPREVLDALLARGSWQFPPLIAVATVPTLRPDGTVLDRAGYDAASGTLYAPAAAFPAVPAQPTRDDAQRALAELAEPYADLPFTSPAARAVALTIPLTLIARPAIRGEVPGVGIDAPTAGTGKSLIADAGAVTATGRRAPRMIEANASDEDRKRLFAIAIAGDPLVLLDNVERPVGNTALAAALTAGTISDLVLGVSEIISAPWRALVVVTGNNLVIRGDTARRFIACRLDARLESPEERADFSHPELLDYMHRSRGRLVAAALTILRGFIVAGRPAQGLPAFGSFEEWSGLVRSALVWAGADDPCASRNDLRATADPARAALTRLLTTWFAVYGSRPLRAAEVLAGCDEMRKELKAAVQEAADDRDAFPTGRAFGNLLSRHRDQVHGHLRLEAAGRDRLSYTMWRVVPAEPQNLAEPLPTPGA